MTQEEVDLIYDYLHENYRYEDGELIAKSRGQGRVEGRILGCFARPGQKKDERAQLRCSLLVNGQLLTIRLSHLIYIYHHKLKPKYIEFIDKNNTNTRIENLKQCSRSRFSSPSLRLKTKNGFYKTIEGKYCARLEYEYQKVFVSSYDSPEIAKNAYDYANTLLHEDKIQIKDIQQMVFAKFPPPVRSKSGFKGVYKMSKNRFKCEFVSNGIKIIVGNFNTPEEAHAAYIKAKAELVLNETRRK